MNLGNYYWIISGNLEFLGIKEQVAARRVSRERARGWEEEDARRTAAASQVLVRRCPSRDETQHIYIRPLTTWALWAGLELFPCHYVSTVAGSASRRCSEGIGCACVRS